jgi:hypothetical protein
LASHLENNVTGITEVGSVAFRVLIDLYYQTRSPFFFAVKVYSAKI